MGNRAVITTKTNFANNGVGVYLHWNGGYDSVEAFLTYCKLKGYRTPETDCYGWARLCQVIGNFFGGELSIGIDKCHNLDCDNGDNGVYVIQNWQICGRTYFKGTEQRNYDLYEMLCEIDDCQPTKEQLGHRKITELLNHSNNMTDTEIEKLWDELEDVPVDEDECLDIDWHGWNKGTHREEIWHWFDEHHSKGVGWLMNERKTEY